MSIKKLTGALLLIGAIGMANASEPKVSVVDKEGNKAFFDKSEIHSINLKTTQVEIIDMNGKSTVFHKDAIAVINLSDEESKVETVTEQGRLIIFATKDEIIVRDSPTSAPWQIFNSTGHIVKSGECNSDNERIGISDMENGVYLFTVSGHTIKFIK